MEVKMGIGYNEEIKDTFSTFPLKSFLKALKFVTFRYMYVVQTVNLHVC